MKSKIFFVGLLLGITCANVGRGESAPPSAVGSIYRVLPYSKKRAKKLGVSIKPSRTGNYKIDVFKNGRLITRIGDKRYLDYPNYIQLEKAGKFPKGYADKRRELYKKRHNKNRKIKESRSWYADNILW